MFSSDLIRTVGETEETVIRPIRSQDADDPPPTLSYHDGIVALWEWLTGETDVHPLDDVPHR